jgi:hypothetical protein
MRKFLGLLSGMFSLGSAMFFTVFAIDLVTGGRPETGTGVLAGLVVFFGGLMVTSGVSAFRMLTTKGVSARAPEVAAPAAGIDISLEQRILALAAPAQGRLTVAEVAVGCAVSLAEAEAALDGLARRGHADMHVTDDGQRVYVVAGFLTAAEKQEAQDVVEATRG